MWYTFTWRDYAIEAKVYGCGSIFGINGGRVSKLMVHDLDASRWVLNYDRGWDFCQLPPEAVAALVAYVEAAVPASA